MKSNTHQTSSRSKSIRRFAIASTLAIVLAACGDSDCVFVLLLPRAISYCRTQGPEDSSTGMKRSGLTHSLQSADESWAMSIVRRPLARATQPFSSRPTIGDLS